MSDRSCVTVLCYGVPPELVGPLTRLLGDIVGADETWTADIAAVVSGERALELPDVPMGTAEEIVGQLADLRELGDDGGDELIPGAPFGYVVWQDPAYEWLGSLFAYRPGHGAFTAECDAQGGVLLSAQEIGQLGRQFSGEEFQARVLSRCGAPWTQRLRDLRQAEQDHFVQEVVEGQAKLQAHIERQAEERQ